MQQGPIVRFHTPLPQVGESIEPEAQRSAPSRTQKASGADRAKKKKKKEEMGLGRAKAALSFDGRGRYVGAQRVARARVDANANGVGATVGAPRSDSIGTTACASPASGGCGPRLVVDADWVQKPRGGLGIANRLHRAAMLLSEMPSCVATALIGADQTRS